MVLGYHVILGAYGFWLPNDERGSWSDFVGAWELLRFGRATKTQERRSLAAEPHDVARRMAAKEALKYPAVHFTGLQARAIARGFATWTASAGATLWACSIMPEHIHLVVCRHRLPIEQMVNQLKGAATRQLLSEGIHPHAGYRTRNGRYAKPFSRGELKVFLDSDDDIRRAVQYVEENPPKEGLRRQPFVRRTVRLTRSPAGSLDARPPGRG